MTLNDFNAFESPDTTFFSGDWELTGGQSSTPRGSFSQGTGVYNFAGGSNADTASVDYFFAAPVDITGFSLLQLSAKLLAGNTASHFDVTLSNLDGSSLVTTFATSSFSLAGVTTFSANLDFLGFPGFDPTQLASFHISGGVVGGTDTLSIALDHLAVAAPVSAVPEPSTYGSFAALALIGIAGFRRRAKTQV